MSEIKIILETGGQSNLKEALADLEKYKELTDAIKSNKESLVKAQDIGNIQKATTELKKAEMQLDAMRKKNAEQTEKENKKLQDQSGILGQLIQKKKQLQGSLLGAKTGDEIRKINSEIGKTNVEIIKLKNSGVSSFNTFEKALASFQFKFNFLGNAVAGLTGALSSIGIEGAKSLFEAAKGAGFFGESIKNAKVNSENLLSNIEQFQKVLDDISKGLDVQFSQAFDSKLISIDLLISKQTEAIQTLSAEYTNASRGLNEEERKQLRAPLTKAEDDLVQLQKQRIIAVEEADRESIKRRVDEAKSQNIERIQDEIRTLGVLNRRNSNSQKELEESSEEFGVRIRSRKRFLEEQIAELEKASTEAQIKRGTLVSDNKKKEDEKNAKESLKNREESLKKEYNAFVTYWDNVDKKNREAAKKILEEQKKLDEERQAQLDKDFEEAQDANLKNQKEAQDNVIKLAKEGNKEQIELLRELKKEKLISPEQDKALAEIEENIRKKRIEEAEKIADTLGKIVEKSTQKQIDESQRLISEQGKAIDAQRDLANRGLENTLAFEEKKKAELEQNERDQQQRLERIKKLEAYFNLFAEYSKDPEKKDKAAFLALKDVLLSEAIASAFAADGGVVEDIATPFAGGAINNGVFLGRSHNSGGIHLEAEGGEGIFSTKEMKNLGKENFYAIKDLLKNPIQDDEFKAQEASFMNVIPIRQKADNRLIGAINQLREDFSKIPQVHQGIDNLDRIVETRIESGIKRTILRPKRQI